MKVETSRISKKNCIKYRFEVLYDSSPYPFRGKRVSDFLFRPYFSFYVTYKIMF